MLKILNPFFVSGDLADVNTCRPIVVAWLQSQAANKVVTMAELRAGLPAIAGKLTRAVVNQLCQDLGAVIQNPEDGAQ